MCSGERVGGSADAGRRAGDADFSKYCHETPYDRYDRRDHPSRVTVTTLGSVMLKLPSLGELDHTLGVRVYLCTTTTDMRKGFDTLAALVREGLGHDPLSGHLFLFVGKRRDRIKVLYWDHDGFALWYKRLEQGTLRMPIAPPEATSIELKASELAMLLEGIDLRSIKRRKRFRREVKDA